MTIIIAIQLITGYALGALLTRFALLKYAQVLGEPLTKNELRIILLVWPLFAMVFLYYLLALFVNSLLPDKSKSRGDR